MSEKKYGVAYLPKPKLGRVTHYVSRNPGTEDKPILSMSRLTTMERKCAAAMTLAEASQVASTWNEFGYTQYPAAIVRLNDTSQEVLDEEEAIQYPDAVAMELRLEAVKLSVDEKVALQHLTNFWNAYLALPHPLDLSEFDPHAAVRNAVNAIQHAMAVRLAKRVDPDVWQ